MNNSYYHIDSIATQTTSPPSVSFTLTQSPRFSRFRNEEVDLVNRLQGLSMGQSSSSIQRSEGRERISSLHAFHEVAAGPCLVYRLQFVDSKLLGSLKNAMANTPGSPPCISWTAPTRRTGGFFSEQLGSLVKELQENRTLPFKVKFQLQRLAYNG